MNRAPGRGRLGGFTPLAQRNQAAVGVVTVVLISLVATLAFFARELPIIGNGETYSANFSESAGLIPGNQVQIAGIKVGEVKSVELDGAKILAEFTVDDRTALGTGTTAAIKIRTLMGEKFVELQPAGAGELDSDEPIPLERTSAPFDIPEAINQLTSTTGQIDSQQLAQSFRAISETFQGTPEHMGEALEGLSKLSETVASRDRELSELLKNSADVTKVVADRNEQVRLLIEDGNRLLGEVQARKEAITGLLVGTEKLSDELRGMVADNQEQIRPALDKLNRVTEMLQRNQDNLSRTVEALAPYVRGFNNTVGNGRWFDGYLCGLLPPSSQSGPLQVNPKGCDLQQLPGSGS
ncbi:MCE family protein [Allosaccharopolyspora coralli]|uniref:MCE family protein n=1 Tax=Allosaccharopolyspora coralli TaxID=2665642 RepID=A0A5Q3Q944_9PSEU|nr:MCE family protein [Allosaccharopolyspora coralli]QGK70350.1 MCE family protein [Allosaccharopolyspora coralli]